MCARIAVNGYDDEGYSAVDIGDGFDDLVFDVPTARDVTGAVGDNELGDGLVIGGIGVGRMGAVFYGGAIIISCLVADVDALADGVEAPVYVSD